MTISNRVLHLAGSSFCQPRHLAGSSRFQAQCRVFWDVDNLRPQQLDRRAVAEAVAAIAARHHAIHALDAFGNENSWRRDAALRPALEAAGFTVHCTPIERQAADRAIDDEARRWLHDCDSSNGVSDSSSGFRTAAGRTLILCSGDRGFERLLHDSRALGVATVCIANTRWSCSADERLPWVHMHSEWDGPRGWRLSKWARELEKNGGHERLSSLYRTRDGHSNAMLI